MNKKQRRWRDRIIVALALFAAAFAVEESGLLARLFGTPGDVYASLALFLIPYLIAGYKTLLEAARNIRRGDPFDEAFLMSVASLGAFAMVFFPDTDPHMAEGAAVMLFYQVGELFQSYAVGQSRKSIAAMMDIAPEFANVEKDGELKQVDPADVAPGTTIVVKPGERVPIDGVVTDGISQLDTAALTGESVPRHVEPGAEVISGCVNMTGVLHVRTTKPYGESSSSSWRTRARRRPAPRTSSRASPASTRRPSRSRRSRSRSSLRLRAWAPGPTGSCAASPSSW